jgi:hypothetical protein
MSRDVRGFPEGLRRGGATEAPADRKERLRLALPQAAELLRTRQAGLIAAGDIDDYVELNWLEWHGGSLRLTVTGSNVCSQFSLARRG